MEALLGLSDTADCMTRVDNLLGDLKTLEDKAQVEGHCLVTFQITCTHFGDTFIQEKQNK